MTGKLHSGAGGDMLSPQPTKSSTHQVGHHFIQRACGDPHANNKTHGLLLDTEALFMTFYPQTLFFPQLQP